MEHDRTIDEISTALRIAVYSALDSVRESPATGVTMFPAIAQLLAVDEVKTLLGREPPSGGRGWAEPEFTVRTYEKEKPPSDQE